jgi:di/tricarboxylate transporter
VDIRKGPNQYYLPELIDTFETGDVLLLEGSYENITSLLKTPGILVMSRKAEEEVRVVQEKTVLCELYVKANSRLLQQKIDKALIKATYGFDVIAIKKGSHYVNAKNKWRTIHSGDTLLASVPANQITRISNLNEFVLLQELEEFTQPSKMRYLAGGIFLMVILLSATNLLPLMISAMLGCVVMFLTGCLSLQRSYRRIDWSIFFLLAGMIPLGAAIVNTGLDVMVATNFLKIFSELNPVFILAGLFLVTSAITSVMSNNATAILLSPIALSIANQLGLDPRPFLVIVMYGASTCYFTPIGYQTNMLIYGPGKYSFKDFMKVGGLLTLIVCVCITLLVYWFYLRG